MLKNALAPQFYTRLMGLAYAGTSRDQQIAYLMNDVLGPILIKSNFEYILQN